MASDLLEGISEKSTKATLLGRLREAAKILAAKQDERLGKLQSIEERVRAKHQGMDFKLQQVIVTASPQEWDETVDFLDNFVEDDGVTTFLPVALMRLRDGGLALKQIREDKT